MSDLQGVRMSGIDGATRLLAIIGDPIAQVKSPLFYNARLAGAGANTVLIPWHVPEKDFGTVMRGLLATANLDGIVITYPFKQRAMAFAARLDAMAERVGAINAMRREADGSWTGGMFDGLGLLQAVQKLGKSVRGARVKLLGAGGTGSAIAHALAASGAASIFIYDAAQEKAETLVSELATFYPKVRVDVSGPYLGEADILINASPVGLSDQDDLPVPMPDLTRNMAVIDIVPRTSTALLRRAAEIGCPHIGGAAMVEGQSDIVLGFFNKIAWNGSAGRPVTAAGLKAEGGL